MPPDEDLEARLRAVQDLTQRFRLERFTYVAATGLSFLALFAIAVRIIFRGEGTVAEFSFLFGSSGLITLTTGNFLKMWDQALRLIASEPINGPRPGGERA